MSWARVTKPKSLLHVFGAFNHQSGDSITRHISVRL